MNPEIQLEGEWHIVRYFRMREHLQPIPIYCTPDNEPIHPDSIAIVHAHTSTRRRPDPYRLRRPQLPVTTDTLGQLRRTTP